MKNSIAAFFALLLLAAAPAPAADLPETGKPAPLFTLPGQDGKPVALSDFKGKWVVLYFYPKDFTSGCSLEAHNFQTDGEKYHALGAVIVGVSVDTVDSHKEFCTKQGLDFKLLADTEHKVSDAYGSLMMRHILPLSARNSFLIDPFGIVRKVYTEVNPATHSAEVLADLKGLRS